MKKASARSVALDVIVSVIKDDAYANLLLPGRIRQASLDSRDAGLATELCHGTLRSRGTYDEIIINCTDRELAKIHPVILAALEMGIHQHMAMRVSTHALVNETVQLVRDSGMAAASGFANAVMRRVTERTTDEWLEVLAEQCRSDVERRSVLTSHPEWIVRAFESALKADNRGGELDQLLEADNQQTPLGIIDLRSSHETLDECTPSAYSPLGYHLLDGGDPAKVTASSHGRIRVQDEGSQLAALSLIFAKPLNDDERWLDMCAAPGGKSAVLAACGQPHSIHVTANEANTSRLELVSRSVAPWSNTSVANADGRDFGHNPEQFDRILVDAPCSGLGALRRRPEARWRKTPADIASLTTLQEQLLLSAIDALKPGGIVAYVTCSPHLAETRAIVNGVLKKRSSITEIDAKTVLSKLARTPISFTGDALSAQLWPHEHNTDAMFIALLVKSE